MTTSNAPRFAQVQVQLSGQDGNVFAIMGRVIRALRKDGATQSDIDEFVSEVTRAGTYDEALLIVMQWVNVS
jgi:hypothetical protein